ncbi:FAD-dependent monooxygenase [Kitasatospora kifunensis]|uniref:2-polyprenyl-6-methoxyphenol hydroxylase-like FAD-dependent oxidoreductase n=1 Tax=Kitasatospora kifunensis TaxID=58351 RepID=A0A7W7R8I3_KITKI|nr:FAD-dependent monooxygenase [Kitasatospora kifunensis]MBB4927230.1 2-polyprenyl-6-methoxyphenol hydroxylase-like FAD-dependent oxidoreductase [Kitasatospora kifunensis]
MQSLTTTPALIVGGGPVGLTLSTLLSQQGVAHLLVEAHPDTSPHPKARGVSARSMEILRRCGLEASIREVGLPASHVFFYRGRDLVDPEFVRTGVTHEAVDGVEHTPSPGLVCSQDLLEPVLLRRARELAPDRIRFGVRLVSFEQVGDGVRAVLQDRAGGEPYTVAADWLVGCDGAASTVRTGAALAMEGPTGLRHFLSVRFEAPLGAVVADRASASYFLTPPGLGGFLAVDNDRQWVYQYPFDPGLPGPHGDLGDHRQLAELIRTMAGLPDLDVTIRSTMTWRMDAQLATAYRRGHVLLAGDAAHVTPPTGGHGMNTGIGDADNLAWKLAAVTAGRADPVLLDSYQAERRPVARQIIELSTENANARAGGGGGYRIDDQLLLTAAYRSTAVIPDAPQSAGTDGSDGTDGTDATGQTLDVSGYHPSGAPGRRLPHARLLGPPGTSSTLDLVGPGFTLLTPQDSPAWRQQAQTATAAGFPVTVHALDGGRLREAEPGAVGRLCGLPATGALLVRPDGHIGWRAARPSHPAELLDVLRRLLAIAQDTPQAGGPV